MINIEQKTDDDAEGGIEIEIVDDTPEADRGRPARSESDQPDIPDDDEIAQYTGNVQKRIKKLRFEYHDQRRAREAAERERGAALEYAGRVKAENERLKDLSFRGEKALVESVRGRVDGEMAAAKKTFREAFDAGDSDAVADAQEKIARLSVQKDRYANYEPTPPPKAEPMEEPVPQPDARALEWNRENSWFGKDKKMTGFAFGVHEELITAGFDPRSDDYYNRLDDEVRRAFPGQFDGSPALGSRPRRVSPVAPSGRTAAGVRKVQLTATQVSLAKRLGLSIEQYVAHMEDNKNG